MDRAVANRYVAALAEIAARPDCALTPESALEQLETFGDLLSSSPELGGVLSSPVVKPEDKRALIRDIGSRAGLDALLVNFLCVVTDERRIGHFALFVDEYRSWLDRHLGRVALEVRLARPVGTDQSQALEALFRNVTGNRVRTTYLHDPAILGGCSVQVGSTLYDGSLRTALNSLGDRLASERQ